MSERPRSAEQYVELVRQAMFEIEDMIEARSFDIDEIENSPAYLDVLLKELRAMRASMADGSYQFGRHDLPMMRIVRRHTEKELPFIRLLYLINQTHRDGLDISDDRPQ